MKGFCELVLISGCQTSGHAVESISDFTLLHGECVSVGIAGACKLAQKMEMLDVKIVENISGTLMKAGLPVKLQGFDINKVYEKMFSDKKVKSNKLTFILPKAIGDVLQCSVEDEELVKKVLKEILL